MPWGFLWQRPHQITSRLANRGHNVVYFQNPIFLNPFLFAKNYKEKNVFVMRKIMKNLYVVNLFLPPFLGKLKFITEKFGLLLFKMQLKYISFKPDIAIFYSSLYTFLLETLESINVKIVYDCIDEFSAFSDVSNALEVLKAERDLATESSIVIATSKRLCERLSKINPDCFYVPNAADFTHFHRATKIGEKPKEIRFLQHPIIGFIGAIYDWIDVDLICKLAELHPDYSILLVGPINFGLDKLMSHSNIMMVGAKKYQVLPQYLACMDVCLIPFKINKLTLASNPIKMYEYLAAGKPVVSTALPEICENASHVVLIARDDEDFTKKVEEAVKECQASENKAAMERRINFARNNSWKQRVETIEKLLKKVIST
jgi:glycosyltransferase involved in cell wall biosynthesis